MSPNSIFIEVVRYLSFILMIVCAASSVLSASLKADWSLSFYLLAWSYINAKILESTFFEDEEDDGEEESPWS